jgi:lipopolysaccharide transport system ATP-binding protein
VIKMSELAINVVDLGKKFRVNEEKKKEFWAFRNVSFSVNVGEVIGIIGSNGSGKSTLLKIISNIMLPTEGFVDIYDHSAMMELGCGFHPEFTGRENIYLSGAFLGMKKKRIDNIFSSIVSFSGLEDFIDMPVKHYSTGMYARLAFAVSSHVDANILLIDEVLSVGDNEFQKKCFSKINEMGESGKTILFVSHSLDSVLSLCKRSILLNNGVVQFDGDSQRAITYYYELLVNSSGKV